MANSIKWKEIAKLECEKKGLYSLSEHKKRDAYENAFNKLRNINIDKNKAKEVFGILRGGQNE